MEKYADIINMPHHRSKTRPHMPMKDRAAQFAPFAALTGYGDAVSETSRLTDRKIELDTDSEELINEKLIFILENINEKPAASITYFVPDKEKPGGKYVTATGRVSKINDFEKTITMGGDTVIPFDNILDIGIEGFSREDRS